MTGAPAEPGAGAFSKRSAFAAVVLAAGFIAAALILRLPLLHDVPRLTDETDEVSVALAILAGARPLTSDDPYRGPLWAYLLAGVMSLTGVTPTVPRLFAATLGALTSGAAFTLAYALAPSFKKVAGTVAAAGAATATGLVTLGAHVAWSNNATPLWVVLGALSVARAAATGRTRWWVAAGLTWAAALQSHPSAIAPLLGMALWWVTAADRRRAIRQRPAAFGIAAFLAVMSPMLLANIEEPLSSVTSASDVDLPVAQGGLVGSLARNALGMAAQLGRFAGAGPLGDPVLGSNNSSDADVGSPNVLIKRFGHPPLSARVGREAEAITNALRTPATWLYATLLLGALGVCLVRGPRLVGAMAALSVVMLPLFNRSWENPYDGRYVGFLVVLGWVALGVLGPRAMLHLRTANADRTRELAAWVVACTAGVVAYPMLVTFGWYSGELATGRTNAPYREEAARLAQLSRTSGAPILVDEALEALQLGGGGNGSGAMQYLLRMEQVEALTAEESDMRWYLAQPDSRVIVLATRAAADRLGGSWAAGTSPEWAVLPLGLGEMDWAGAGLESRDAMPGAPDLGPGGTAVPP